VAVCDVGRIFQGNRAAEVLLGYLEGELQGIAISALHPQGANFTLDHLLERTRAGDDPSAELTLVRKDGVSVWVQARAVLVSGAALLFLEDVTQRTLEQRASQSVIAAARAAVITSDEQQRIVTANPAATRMFGYSQAELQGKPLSILLPERLRARHEELHRALGHDGPTPNMRGIPGLRRDGRELSLDVSVSRIAVAGHYYYSAIVRETNARDSMLEQLHASDERFSRVFQTVPVGLVLIRLPDNVVVEVNEAYLRISGFTRDHVVGQNYRSFVSDPEATARIALKFRTDGFVSDQPYTYVRPDGSSSRALVTAKVQTIGHEPYILVTVTDVTERTAAEEAMRASAERFRELAESIREVFWLADPKTADFTYASPAFSDIWGLKLESFKEGRAAWRASIHPEDQERVFRDMLGRQVRGEYDEEYRIRRPDGGERWVHARAFPVKDASGTVIRIAGVVEDVTKRHELEVQLRQTQKLESMGRLAGGIAHDFNNWLTVISGNVKHLERTYPFPEATELLQEVRAAADRATALTRQLLAFSRRDVVEKRSVDLNEVVRETMKMLGRLLGEDISINTRLSAGLGRVLADPSHMVQVLMNLAVNARDAMPEGGDLTLSTATIEVVPGDGMTSLQPGRYSVITVRDTGTGMSSEVRTRIFEPFYTTKGIGRGTGLGLAVVHGIVQQSGGDVLVDSEPGKGATFKVYLPEHEGRTEAVQKSEVPAAPKSGRETLLVVEDEDSVRRVAVRILAAEGYAVLFASSGKETLAILDRAQQRVDLLITDVVMPKMDGARVAEAVTQRFPNAKVLYTSGYTDDAVVRHGVSSATLAFLQKPYDRTSLLRKVRSVLDDSD
jgi:PAS domain S-box-containing protein